MWRHEQPRVPEARRRITEVWSDSANGTFGSGYLLGGGLVLTARHVVLPEGSIPPTVIKARPLGIAHQVEGLQDADLIWPDVQQLGDQTAPDVALLRLRDFVDSNDAGPPLGPPNDEGKGNGTRVSATGFPAFVPMVGQRRDTEEIAGEVFLGTTLVGGRYQIKEMTVRDREKVNQELDWHGMSGAALLADGCVIGVLIARKSAGQRYDFSAIRIEQLLSIPAFVAAISGHVVFVEDKPAQSPHRVDFRRQLGGLASQLPHSSRIDKFIDSYLGSSRSPEPFGGRNKEILSLNTWLLDPSAPSYLCLTAPSGRGKSTLLVHWLDDLTRNLDREILKVVFVPVTIRYGLNGEGQFFEALGCRLANAYNVTSNAPTDASADLWRGYVANVLERSPENGCQILIVIDGIDEAAAWEIGRAIFPRQPPAGLRVIVSAREQVDRNQNQWLDSLDWGAYDTVQTMTLSPLDASGIVDVLRRMGAPIDGLADNREIITQLVRLTEGDPLILSLYAKDLWRQKKDQSAIIDASDLPKIAPGLDGYFDRWWKDQEQLWTGKLADRSDGTRIVFNILATAFGPLSRAQLLYLVRKRLVDFDGDHIETAVSPLSRFVIFDHDSSTYTLSHPRLGNHRYNRLVQDGDAARFERLFLDWGHDTLESSTKNAVVPQHSNYIARYYLAHLSRANASTDMFLPLVGPGWRLVCNIVVDEYGLYASCVEDIFRRLAEADRINIEAGTSADFFGHQIRCTLELASFGELTSAVAPAMVAELLRFGVWNVTTALTFSMRLEKDTERVDALAVTIPFVSGGDLMRAEHLVSELGEIDHDDLGDVQSALCRRLHEVGQEGRAATLAHSSPSGYPRARACLALAQVCSAPSLPEWLSKAYDEFGQCNAVQRHELVKRYVEDVLPRIEVSTSLSSPLTALQPDERAAIITKIKNSIEEQIGKSVTPSNLALDKECQYLSDLVPFLSNVDRFAYLHAFFAGVQTGEIISYAATAFVEVALFIDASLKDLAISASLRLEEEADIALCLLALWPILESSERSKFEARVRAAAPSAAALPGTSDRMLFFEILAKRGFASIALDVIASQDPKSWKTSDLLIAVAPFLSLQESRRAIDLVRCIRVETREASRRAILARLAGFSPSTATEALHTASSTAANGESTFALAMLEVFLAPPTYLAESGSIDKLVRISNPALRAEAIALLTCAPIRVSAANVHRALSSFKNDRLCMRAFESLVECVADDELCSALMEGTVKEVALWVPSEDKHVELSHYFRRAFDIGLGATAYEFGRSICSRTFDVPLAAAILAAAKSGSLLEKKKAASDAKMLTRSWVRLAALAALDRGGIDVNLAAEWNKECSKLSELEVLFNANNIALFLNHVSEVNRESMFEEVANHCTFLMTDRPQMAADALKYLSRVAPAHWIRRWAQRLDEVGSSTRRNALRTAFAKRMSELGECDEAIELIRAISQYRYCAEALAALLTHLPAERVEPMFEYAVTIEFDHEQIAKIWCAIAQRLPAMTKLQVLSLAAIWLRHSSRQPARKILLAIGGAAALIDMIGGKAALSSVLGWVYHFGDYDKVAAETG